VLTVLSGNAVKIRSSLLYCKQTRNFTATRQRGRRKIRQAAKPGYL